MSVAITLIASPAFSQAFPDRIDGYKVHEVSRERSDGLFRVSFGEPEFSGVGLNGFTFEVVPSLTINERSGKVDRIGFTDFEVNGISVSIEDYEREFAFRKGETVVLEAPLEIVVGFPSALKGTAKEIKKSEESWKVKGTVLVFGRYKWAFFTFKRVVPVEVEFSIPNPLKALRPLALQRSFPQHGHCLRAKRCSLSTPFLHSTPILWKAERASPSCP